MTLGLVLLVHSELERPAQLIRHLSERGYPVVVHMDARDGNPAIDAFKAQFDGNERVRFIRSRRCDWGTWSLVDAAQDGAFCLLDSFPEVDHVFLASGACIPLRPLNELTEFLARHPDTDFIESVTVEDVDWTVGGLSEERFTLWFPFRWKTQRWLFDKAVDFQRRLGVRRRVPKDLEPQLGSQWWCLTRQTLCSIRNDADRPRFERYFRTTWIPDESYFQTLVRRHARRVSSRSLTLSKFDHRGKPHVFYDDHLALLRRSDCFFARKIWPKADKLYLSFLSDLNLPANTADPAPGMIERAFVAAAHRRRFGRDGLYMPGREPHHYARAVVTAAPYWVFEGFEDIFPGFSDWFGALSQARMHGHLFAPDRVEFADDDELFAGVLNSTSALRDYRPQSFLTNLIWNTRGERQAFHFGPSDRQDITETLIADPNARVFAITGAWALDLFERAKSGEDVRKIAARRQRTEAWHAGRLRDRWSRAQVRIWSLADAVHTPADVLGAVFDSALSGTDFDPMTCPETVQLDGVAGFLQGLRDDGMNPHMAGDFTIDLEAARPMGMTRPYLVK